VKAIELYAHLEKDFILQGLWDEWSKYMGDTKDFICTNFLKRSMGLVYDFAEDINKVYTAVFPEKSVTDKILNDNIENAMLFVHHPSIWLGSGNWNEIDLEVLKEFKKRKISVYNLTCYYKYGEDEIKDGMVALIAGGGNDLNFLKEMLENDIHILVTGITCEDEHSKESHDFAKENKISLLGGTHYSTEKFACIKMCDYFKRLGLTSEFIEGKPVFFDM